MHSSGTIIFAAMEHTIQQYNGALLRCRKVFEQKAQDYGTAWRILRLKSLTDQIWIKAKRIRTIEELPEQKVADGVETEYVGIVNYCLMALIQLDLGVSEEADMHADVAVKAYDKWAEATKALMIRKNHDYGEAWRDMRISSLTDMILQKLLRIKQIEDNEGRTLVSEGLDANYQDIINYALFALIRLEEQQGNKE